MRSSLEARFASVLACGAIAVVAGGCGDNDGSGENGAGTTTIEAAEPAPGSGDRDGRYVIAADSSGEPAFDRDLVEAEPGRVTFVLDNPAATEHSLCVEGEQLGTLGCTTLVRETRARLRLHLEPGTYAFFCNAEGHRAAGMEGVVEAR